MECIRQAKGKDVRFLDVVQPFPGSNHALVTLAPRVGRFGSAIYAARAQQRTQAGMQIAATAHLDPLTLVTRNIRGFEDDGVGLLDPFS